jgi:hypothetical protein
VDICQQFIAIFLLNLSQQKVSNISRPAAQSLRNLGKSLQLTDHSWSITMCDMRNIVPAAARESRQPFYGETYDRIVSFLCGWLQIHLPQWILIERYLSNCGTGIKYNLLSSKKLYFGTFSALNFVNITTRIIIILIFVLP